MVRIEGNNFTTPKVPIQNEAAITPKTEASNIEAPEVNADQNHRDKANNNEETEYRMMLDGSTYLQFSINKETSGVVIKIVDNKTKEVIREIPPEKVLDIAARLSSKTTGFFIDQKR